MKTHPSSLNDSFPIWFERNSMSILCSANEGKQLSVEEFETELAATIKTLKGTMSSRPVNNIRR